MDCAVSAADWSDWNLIKYEDPETFRARFAELEAQNERLRTALVAIQSTTPGPAHRIAIQALREASD